jgi:hypothetical protein
MRSFILAAVFIAGCGFEPNTTPVHIYYLDLGVTEEGVNAVRDIVFEIAQHELPDVAQKVEDYGYIINILPWSAQNSTKDCGTDNDLGCTHMKIEYVEDTGSNIYAFGDNACGVYSVLAHEFIHYVGFPYGRYLGCPAPDTKWVSNDVCHSPPYFEQNATTDAQRYATWEWCATGRAMLALCPNRAGEVTAAQMSECDY